MKLIQGFIITECENEYVAVVADGAVSHMKGAVNFNGIIRMNKTAAYIAELMKNEITEDMLVSCVSEKFRTDAETARKNVKTVISSLSGAGLIQ